MLRSRHINPELLSLPDFQQTTRNKKQFVLIISIYV